MNKISISQIRLAVDAPEVILSPYVWKKTAAEENTVIEAAMPGAYLKFAVTGSDRIGIVIDATGNRGCSANSMPVVEYSVDNGPMQTSQLGGAGETYVLTLAEHLDRAATHCVEFYFRAANLEKRWEGPITHLCLAGIVIEKSARLTPVPKHPWLAIGFGDSITEGVGIDGRFTSWQHLEVNRACGTWLPLVCNVLGCEYG